MNECELELIAKAEITKWLETAKAKYNRDFIMPSLSFRLRGIIAGQWSQNRYRMKLNPILMSQNLEEFKTRTIPHECAHLIAYALHYRPKPHGHEWKSIMRTLGIQDVKRTHSYDTTTARVVARPYIYKCSCQEHALTNLLHRKIQNGQRRWCMACKQTIVFVRMALPSPSNSATMPA